MTQKAYSERLLKLKVAARRASNSRRALMGVALLAGSLATMAKRDDRDAESRIATIARNLHTEDAEVPSQLEGQDEPGESRSLSSYLLTGPEKAMLAHEHRRKVAPAPVVLDPEDEPLPAGAVNPTFAPFVSVLDGLSEPNAFELAIADLPLALMPAPRVLELTA